VFVVRISAIPGGHHLSCPVLNHGPGGLQVQAFVHGWILFKVRVGQGEQSNGWFQPVFLKVDEGSRELDQALVKSPVHPGLATPEFFKHLVSFIKLAPVEAVKEGEIVGPGAGQAVGLN
jgi:hypothetical protein